MPVALFAHESGLDHATPDGHPERADRLRALERVWADPRFAALERREAPAAAEDRLRLAHPSRHLDVIRAASETAAKRGAPVSLDPDTHVSAGSHAAALHAVGGAVAAVDLVMADAAGAAFVACRPPGHHCEPERPMGFCLFATAAIAALHAMEAHGLSRVAVADFDVHHGNGTQAVFWSDPRVVFASSHEMPLYPGTGDPSETGEGNIFNAALDGGSGGPAFRAAWEDRLLPAIEAHRPELIVVSAGFDAHRNDPLASLELEAEDFAWITGRLCDAAEGAGARLVSVLEGGYDLDGLAVSAAAHVGTLMERRG